MSTDAPPPYNADIDSAPPLYEAEAGVQPSAPVAQPPPAVQQVVVQQQPQPQQIVYVDQFGNPIQQPQQQVVYVVQSPNPNPAVAVQPQVVQQQPQTVQAMELQVTNNAQVPVDPAPSQIPLNTTYAPKDDNHKWINDDELPPDYESIIAGEDPKEAPKAGMGCIDGCMATPHLKSWFFTLLVVFFLLCYVICLIGLDSMCTCDCYSFYWSTCNDSLDTCDSYDLECDFPCSMTYALGGGFWGIVAAAYVFYLCEVFFCSSSFKYLRNVHEQETIYKYIERLHTYPPTVC